MTTRNKQDVVDVMSERADISKTEAEAALNAFTDFITETLIEGGKVSLVGWGGFEASLRQARTGRNPQTGAEMQIPAATVPKFKAGKKFKDAVNEGATK